MSLRPRDFAIARIGRAGQRMAPGGRRWSESPVPRPGVRRPRQVGMADAPLYWWKFDEASGGAALEVNGGPSIVWDEEWVTAGYQATALAPGSTYATTVDYDQGQVGGFEDATPGIGPGADGLIVVDFWVAGLVTDPTPGWGSSQIFVMWQNVGSAELEMNIGNNYGTVGDPYKLGFTIDTVYVCTIAATWDDPAHVRWAINPTAGTSVITINDVEVSNESGVSISWDPAEAWSLSLSTSWADTTFDELKIYGTAS